MKITLDVAQKITSAALEKKRELGLKPLTIAVLDAGGHMITLVREDGASNMRPEIARGKAFGAISMGLGSRAIFKRAQEQPYFVQAMNELAGGALVPVPGGVLILDKQQIIGAVGITGDTSDNDELCAIAGIEAVQLSFDTGA